MHINPSCLLAIAFINKNPCHQQSTLRQTTHTGHWPQELRQNASKETQSQKFWTFASNTTNAAVDNLQEEAMQRIETIQESLYKHLIAGDQIHRKGWMSLQGLNNENTKSSKSTEEEHPLKSPTIIIEND